MSIAFVYPGGDLESWLKHFRSQAPDIPLQVWPEIRDPGSVLVAASWDHPSGLYNTMKNLQCIVSLGAGVDHVLRDKNLPGNVTICRVIDPDLSNAVAEYVVWAALHLKREFSAFLSLQRERVWQRFPRARSQRSLRVGIMGLGEIGVRAAHAFAALGWTVSGWSNNKKSVPGVQSFAGRGELEQFLGVSDVLVCLLPLTPDTEGILNAKLFSHLPEGAFLINAGRGAHLVEDDLLPAIKSGKLGGACLDVFRKEPLPTDHPFWSHPAIIVTPHMAGLTRASNAARQIIESYRRIKDGLPPLNAINRDLQY